MLAAEADGDPIPQVDESHKGGEVHRLRFGEMAPYLFVGCIGGMGLRDPGNSLRPGERRPLSWAVEGGFLPRVQQTKGSAKNF